MIPNLYIGNGCLGFQVYTPLPTTPWRHVHAQTTRCLEFNGLELNNLERMKGHRNSPETTRVFPTKNREENYPPIIHLFIGFWNHYFHHPFCGSNPPIVGNIHQGNCVFGCSGTQYLVEIWVIVIVSISQFEPTYCFVQDYYWLHNWCLECPSVPTKRGKKAKSDLEMWVVMPIAIFEVYWPPSMNMKKHLKDTLNVQIWCLLLMVQ